MEALHDIVENIGSYIDLFGVLVLVIAVLFASVRFVASLKQPDSFKVFRQGLGKGILLGLEILVAGDIVRTVGVPPTMQSVLVLAVVVVIRTFMSWSLEVELEGRWPWHNSVD